MERPSYLCTRMRILLLSLLLVIATLATAQDDASGKRNLVQFSGVVVTGDSLQPVPFTNILIKNSYRGTMSDIYGYFSFVAQMGDTILFSAIGFQRSSFAIPDSLKENKVCMIHVMHSDTTLVAGTLGPPLAQQARLRPCLPGPASGRRRLPDRHAEPELRPR